MFNFKKIQERETTKEVLSRLKSEEKPINASNNNNVNVGGVTYLNFGMDRKELPKDQGISNISEHNIENILRQINSLEKHMKESTSNYLNLFYDLRKLEDKFIKAVEFAKANNIKVKDSIAKEITGREEIMSRRKK